jgi:hypothetical protein
VMHVPLICTGKTACVKHAGARFRTSRLRGIVGPWNYPNASI